jgi:hypothetical protein
MHVGLVQSGLHNHLLECTCLQLVLTTCDIIQIFHVIVVLIPEQTSICSYSLMLRAIKGEKQQMPIF